jgi:general L-amino acid transport system permease protein
LIRWIRKSFFTPWYYGILTFFIVLFLYLVIKNSLEWAINAAEWEVITINLRLFLLGIYPEEAVWRLWVILFFLSIFTGVTWKRCFYTNKYIGIILLIIPLFLSFIPSLWITTLYLYICALCLLLGAFIFSYFIRTKKAIVICWASYLPIMILFIGGITPGGFLYFVESSYWSGLLLTFLIAIVGILLSFPLGIFLALGRISKLPLIRYVSIFYIEIIRGLPLITLLFMIQVMLPLFLPEGVSIDRVLRAILTFICFSAAYLAENIRGGLQGISKGQYEAAYALGLSHLRTQWLIILPQALRNVIPILVGQFIALFKDTSLVAVVGLLDFLGISQSILANPSFLGKQKEVFLFIGFIYWIFSWSLALASQKLEKHLKVEGHV